MLIIHSVTVLPLVEEYAYWSKIVMPARSWVIFLGHFADAEIS